jgi:hypothetical protein
MPIPGAMDGGQDGGQLAGTNGSQALLAGLAGGAIGRGFAAGGSVVVPFDGSLDLESGQYQMLSAKRFPDSAWDPGLRAQLLLAKFASRPWFDPTVVKPPRTSLADEVRQLVADVPLRNARLPEIIAQSDDFTPYWCNLLMVTPGSRPSTWLMLLTMLQIGTLVAMRYKAEFNSPRPVQVYPALSPCILSPGHPSFPQGHALQCYLIADFLKRANPNLGEAADNLADRIGRNREIAGVHFPRDRVASRQVADHLRPLLYRGWNADGTPGDGVLDPLLVAVAQEFDGVTSDGPPTSRRPAKNTGG